MYEEWFRFIVYPFIDKGWIMEPYGSCKYPVVKTKDSEVRIQMLICSDCEKRMHASVIFETDALKGLLVH